MEKLESQVKLGRFSGSRAGAVPQRREADPPRFFQGRVRGVRQDGYRDAPPPRPTRQTFLFLFPCYAETERVFLQPQENPPNSLLAPQGVRWYKKKVNDYKEERK